MFISKKKWKQMEERIYALEQKTDHTYNVQPVIKTRAVKKNGVLKRVPIEN